MAVVRYYASGPYRYRGCQWPQSYLRRDHTRYYRGRYQQQGRRAGPDPDTGRPRPDRLQEYCDHTGEVNISRNWLCVLPVERTTNLTLPVKVGTIPVFLNYHILNQRINFVMVPGLEFDQI